jgi:type IV secretion system protein VirB10
VNSNSTPEPEAPESVAGERGVASVTAARSLQSRVSNILAMALMSSLGLGLLGWYYVRTFSHPSEVKQKAQTASRNQAAGEMALPSLGRIDPPSPTFAKVLGPAPDAPPPMPTPADPNASSNAPGAPPGAAPQAAPKPAWMVTMERRLAGPVSEGPQIEKTGASSSPGDARSAAAGEDGAPASGESALAVLLRPSATPATRARVLPAERLLLPKGAFIDCTLETAIDSTLPGMTTCITATDTFGVDGSTVLIERGSKLVGETRGEVAQGQARLFVLWTEARTPTGVIVPLASPGTDELGRSGLSGDVNRHFFQRFSAAILISVINGALQAAVSSRNSGGTVIYNPSGSQDIMTEVLKSTVNIAPTITKNQGDRIEILVARDLDFRSVYELKSTSP